MKTLTHSALLVGLLAVFCPLTHAGVVDDFHQLQGQLDSSILDVYDGTASVQTGQSLSQAWQTLRADLSDSTARSLVPADFSFQSPADLAGKIGASRALL